MRHTVEGPACKRHDPETQDLNWNNICELTFFHCRGPEELISLVKKKIKIVYKRE